MERQYKFNKKSAVQLTSLLDLLFVMIFVSLIQQKNITPEQKTEASKSITKKTNQTSTVVPKKETLPRPVPAKLKVIDIAAIFHFYPSTNTKLQNASGKYRMEGTYNERSRKVNLYGVSPIDMRPEFAMVPIVGELGKDSQILSGRIDSIGCENFNLKKVTSKNGIFGKWVGTYSCAQGQTGLTLSIMLP